MFALRGLLALRKCYATQPYLTEYDDELSGDSYIDPLGVLVIWSAFGQQIFKNRVNSISNDVRNYTLNLLHHALIRDLCDDDAVQPSRALVDEVGDKNSLALRQACLVYLENIFTYAMVESASTSVDGMGILGAKKARARLEQAPGGNPLLQFTHKKSGYLLVRQLGLGVSGRYKTPFKEMGFFNAAYNLPARQLFALAEQRCDSTAQQLKLAHVQALEPLLAEAHLLFTLAHHAKSQRITEIEAPLDGAWA